MLFGDGVVVIALASLLRGRVGIRTRGHEWVKLVLCSASRGFSPGSPVFPSPQKSTFDQMQDLPENHFQVSGASWVNINNYY